MRIEQSDFVLSIFFAQSAVVISIPHSGLRSEELSGYFASRQCGTSLGESCLPAFASDINHNGPVASVVRGLLPRSLCDYNRPLRGTGGEMAFADERLASSYTLYHTQIKKLLCEARRIYGKAYLIDLHGFDPERSGLPYDLVLGSQNGQTAHGLDIKALKFFEEAGYKTLLATNGQKFSGGYTIGAHKGCGISALQIEVSKRFRQRPKESEEAGKQLAEEMRLFILSLP